MTETEEQSLFTVGVFPDTTWAERGLDALKRNGFAPASLSIVAKHTPDAAELAERSLGVELAPVEITGLGAAVAGGSLVGALQGSDQALGRAGLAASFRRVGFQAHDGFIFETLTARGGVLVAIESAPLAADALTVLHAYGGGNAAIGAWAGRV
jgi:hypothetical protein